MAFEIDPLRSNANLRKHGIDFLEAQDLWLDPAVLVIPERTLDALRFLVIGRLHGHHWSAVITYHRLAISLISVRRSLHEEVQLYEKLWVSDWRCIRRAQQRKAGPSIGRMLKLWLT